MVGSNSMKKKGVLFGLIVLEMAAERNKIFLIFFTTMTNAAKSLVLWNGHNS